MNRATETRSSCHRNVLPGVSVIHAKGLCLYFPGEDSYMQVQMRGSFTAQFSHRSLGTDCTRLCEQMQVVWTYHVQRGTLAICVFFCMTHIWRNTARPLGRQYTLCSCIHLQNPCAHKQTRVGAKPGACAPEGWEAVRNLRFLICFDRHQWCSLALQALYQDVGLA
jgi:hypothetical protein